MIDIKGLDKAEVLLALWTRSKFQGVSFLGYTGEMTLEQAKEIINHRTSISIPLDFDYLNGRVMKVDISGDEFDERLYDRDNGGGAARDAVDALRKNGIETFLNGRNAAQSSAKSMAALAFGSFLNTATFGGYNKED